MTTAVIAESFAPAPVNAASSCAHGTMRGTLLEQIERELEVILDDFDSAPSRTSLFEVGTVAEVVILGRDLPTGQRLARVIGQAGRRWIERGLFEDVCFSEAQLTHHTMLLLVLSAPVPSEVLQALSDQRMIGRSEWPVLTQLCIGTMLNQAGINLALPEADIEDLTACIDKRCLRAQSGEYDLALLLTAAQLLQDDSLARLRPSLRAAAPHVLPRVLAVQALRAGNWNWLAVLAFLCRRSFGLPDYLDQALQHALSDVPTSWDQFDLPKDIREQSEHFSRSVRALRLRSAAALALYLDCCQK